MTKKEIATKIASSLRSPSLWRWKPCKWCSTASSRPCWTRDASSCELRCLRGQAAASQEGTQPSHRKKCVRTGEASCHVQAGTGDGATSQGVEGKPPSEIADGLRSRCPQKTMVVVGDGQDERIIGLLCDRRTCHSG